VSLGVSFDDLGSARNVVTAAATDGSFSLVVAINPQTSTPEARITSAGAAPLVIPWNGPSFPAKERVLLSLSIAPQPTGLTAQWFLDGVQVSSLATRSSVAGVSTDGTVTIGGDQGFKGVVDEFGIYTQDAAGRPSTDPDLYSRAQAGEYGARLIYADGFDGLSVSHGFSIEGKGQLALGAVTLAPGARLSLPPLRTGQAVSVSADLSPDSSRTPTLIVQWEGSSASALRVPVIAGTGGLKFLIASGGQSITVPSADGEKIVSLTPPSGSTSLILKLEDPAESKSNLVVESVLAVTSR
jgi:hypothetical protein